MTSPEAGGKVDRKDNAAGRSEELHFTLRFQPTSRELTDGERLGAGGPLRSPGPLQAEAVTEDLGSLRKRRSPWGSAGPTFCRRGDEPAGAGDGVNFVTLVSSVMGSRYGDMVNDATHKIAFSIDRGNISDKSGQAGGRRNLPGSLQPSGTLSGTADRSHGVAVPLAIVCVHSVRTADKLSVSVRHKPADIAGGGCPIRTLDFPARAHCPE